MKIKLFPIFLLVSLLGCNNKKKPESNIIKKFYKNGIIESQGFLNKKKQKIGKWDYFNKDGTIDKTFEYKIINGKQYTNQGWHFNKSKNDTLKEFGNYYKFNGFKKKQPANKAVLITVDYKPILALNSDISLFTSRDINKDFDNIKSVKLDTIIGENMKFVFYFTTQTKTLKKKKGINHFRGFIKEYYYKDPTEDDDTTYKERILYFDEEYIVD